VVLAAVLAASAAAVLGHLLVSAVRSRRRDFAMLATLGFVPGQLRSAVRWQATVVALVASLVGIPLGVAAGRVLWTRFADGIHAVSAPTVPWWEVALAAPVAIVVANAVAAVPGRWASRTSPAATLRQE
jgi:ABC-type lipoprotein release transport system permease subunit